MNQVHRDIELLLALYFDGLYFGDSRTLRTVFHPQARYICAVNEEELILDMPAYFRVVEQRQAPASTGQQRRDRIVSIRQVGPQTALAEVQCAIGNRHFTDLLSLVRLQGRWQIIAKVFHYDIQEEATDALCKYPDHQGTGECRTETCADQGDY